MSQRIRKLLTGTIPLMMGLVLGQANAQDLVAYQKLAVRLESAAQTADKDSVKTLKSLDGASAAFKLLAPTLTNQQLAGGIRNAISSAMAAQAGAPAELQAQVTLARGLMRKALYDQTLNVLATSPNKVGDRLNVLAREYGLDAGGIKALKADAQAGKINLVSWRLQRSGMKKVGILLDRVKAEQSPNAFLNAAKATAWFSAVQDTGRLLNPPVRVNQFTQLVSQVAGGDLGGIQTSLNTLKQNVATLNTKLKAPPSGVVNTPSQSIQVEPAPSVPVTSSKASATPPTPAKSQESVSTSSTPTPLSVAGTGDLSLVYASLGRALTAAGHGDVSTAKKHLAKVPKQMVLAPKSIRSTSEYTTFMNEVKAAKKRTGLRVGDVQALIARLNNLEARAVGRPMSALDNLSSTIADRFGGMVRVLIGLLLAILAFVPLYFLNLAFGGKNPYWRSISAAILILFLPTLLEGLFGFLSWLGGLTGVGFLQGLTNLTLHQGLYGLPLSWILNLFAIALATYGFRGLCEQFGLLGSRSNAVAVADADGSVDWDEEI